MRFPGRLPATIAVANLTLSKSARTARTATRAARLMVSAREGSDGQVESLEGDGARDGSRHGDRVGHRPRRRELVGLEPGGGGSADSGAGEQPPDPAAETSQREVRSVSD